MAAPAREMGSKTNSPNPFFQSHRDTAHHCRAAPASPSSSWLCCCVLHSSRVPATGLPLWNTNQELHLCSWTCEMHLQAEESSGPGEAGLSSQGLLPRKGIYHPCLVLLHGEAVSSWAYWSMNEIQSMATLIHSELIQPLLCLRCWVLLHQLGTPRSTDCTGAAFKTWTRGPRQPPWHTRHCSNPRSTIPLFGLWISEFPVLCRWIWGLQN